MTTRGLFFFLTLDLGNDDKLITIGTHDHRSSSRLEAAVSHSIMGAPKIITCSSSKELAHAVSTFIQPHHNVAELGSQLRDVSEEICKRCQNATLVDVLRDVPKSSSNQKQESKRTQAMRIINAGSSNDVSSSSSESHNIMFQPNAKFSEITKLSDWRQAFFSSSSSTEDQQQQQCYDVFVLDVNAIVGNDLEWTALDLILEFESMSNMMWNQQQKQKQEQQQHHEKKKKSTKQKSLKYVLVKSLGLNRLASQLTYTEPWLEERSKEQEIQDTNNNDQSRKQRSTTEVTRYVATVGVKEYRQTIPVTVDKDDFVVEVGCHFGTSTEILHQYAKHCIGADVGNKIIKEAQSKYPTCILSCGECLENSRIVTSATGILSRM